LQSLRAKIPLLSENVMGFECALAVFESQNPADRSHSYPVEISCVPCNKLHHPGDLLTSKSKPVVVRYQRPLLHLLLHVVHLHAEQAVSVSCIRNPRIRGGFHHSIVIITFVIIISVSQNSYSINVVVYYYYCDLLVIVSNCSLIFFPSIEKGRFQPSL
jgi:hypothetical protein